MLSHATARDWLIPYADGMLAADERKRVDGHILGCAECAADLREVRELNLLLVSLPPAPPAAFAPFWLNLQAVLPQRRTLRVPNLLSYRRVGIAFALAGTTVLAMTGAALAASGAMPDNPIYPLKQLEESIQLATTPASSRLDVEIKQAGERLHEATVMAMNHKPLLAESSLAAFRVTVNDAASALKNANPRLARQEIDRLRAGLDAVEHQNAARNDDDSGVRQLVMAAAADLDQIENANASSVTPTLVVGSEATPDPTPAPKPRPTVRPTARPAPSPDDEHRR